MSFILALLLLVAPVSVTDAKGAATGGPARPSILDRAKSIYSGNPALSGARDQWKSGRFGEAGKRFKKVLSGKLDPEVRKQVEFLRARMLYDAGEYKEAAHAFESLAGPLPVLKDWCHYYAARSHYEDGAFQEAVNAFSVVSERFPRRRVATELTCSALHQLGESVRFSDCLHEYAKQRSPPPSLLLLLAEIHVEAGDIEKAVALLKRIEVEHPASRDARKAHRRAKELQKGGLTSDARLTGEERLAKAEKLYSAYHYSSALKIAGELMKDSSKESSLWCRSLGLTARAWARKREETASQPWFEKFVNKCEAYHTAPTLFRGIDAARKAGKIKNAEKWTAVLVKSFPDTTLCDDALLYVARMHDRKGNVDEVKRAVDDIFARYGGGDMAPEAAWLLVFSHYKKKRYKEAFATAERFQGMLPERQNYKTNGRLLYWMGRIRQRQGKKKEALPYFEQAIGKYPFGWYALLSYLRLEQYRKGRGDEVLKAAAGSSAPLLPGPDQVAEGAAQRKLDLGPALLFLRLELKEEAQAELSSVLDTSAGNADDERLLLAAYLYDRAGHYSLSHQILRREVPAFQYTFPGEDDDRWWKLAYPSVFRKLVTKSADDEGIPWSIVIGVMREESGFNPRIESYAHALGLMQLLQKTASWVAGKQMSRRRLRIPRHNIPLGVKYLRYLSDKFGHPVMMVAGYNSGPGGVYKTLKRTRRRHIDEFVEQIPYDQTRRYTKRVMSSAWTYQVLYGDKKGAIPFRLKFPKQKKKKKKKKK